jgi:hypothetical protein
MIRDGVAAPTEAGGMKVFVGGLDVGPNDSRRGRRSHRGSGYEGILWEARMPGRMIRGGVAAPTEVASYEGICGRPDLGPNDSRRGRRSHKGWGL